MASFPHPESMTYNDEKDQCKCHFNSKSTFSGGFFAESPIRIFKKFHLEINHYRGLTQHQILQQPIMKKQPWSILEAK